MPTSSCSVPGCDVTGRVTRGMCGMHYARWLRHGDALVERYRKPDSCTVDACDRTVEARELCRMHYQRWWEGRDIGSAESQRQPNRICTIPDCGMKARGLGLCLKHWERKRKHGDPNVTLIVWHGDEIGYGSAHDRVRRLRGSPSGYDCTHCGRRANDWAYNHQDPDERRGLSHGKDLPFSLSPDFYIPLCKTCHRRFDLSNGRAHAR